MVLSTRSLGSLLKGAEIDGVWWRTPHPRCGVLELERDREQHCVFFPKSQRDMDVPSFSYPTALQRIALKES